MVLEKLFPNSNPEKRKRNIRMAIIGSSILISTIAAITLLIVLIPRQGDGEPDVIECPGFPGKGNCLQHGCIYDNRDTGPFCKMAKNAFGYILAGGKTETDYGISAKLKNISKTTPYGPNIKNVAIEVHYLTENIVRIKLFDGDAKRYEVPAQEHFPLLKFKTKVDRTKLKYSVLLSNESGVFSYKVMRDDGTVLWDTSIGGLVMSDKYLQIASFLPSEYIYGLGEHTRKSLKHDLKYMTWPMFSRDRAPLRGRYNLYGVHPFYTCLEESSKSHGVLLLNSNAMEATLLPAPAISFRTIGGILDFFYFVGDNPEHVIQLYTSLVGRPLLPPYWSLGFQLSRYGYNSLANVKAAVERTRKAEIPQDVQYLDIDHMEGNKDFTYDKKNFAGLLEYVKETKEKYGLKWIIIVDPAIAASSNYEVYQSGLKSEVFIKRSPEWSDSIFPAKLRGLNITFGKVWPSEPVAFPDFFLEQTKEWWVKCFVDWHKQLPFDGIWIDMNEPSNFGTNGEDYEFCSWTNVPQDECWVLKCPESEYDNPPYNPLKTSGSPELSSKTLCMGSRQGTKKHPYLHYDVHSLYAWSQSLHTKEAAEQSTGTRSIVISRSTYPSSGSYVGHWLGDNKSDWEDLHDSIIGMLEFNLFGIPYIGADVCGFEQDTNDELCYRWMQLGAFYPFFRNHNGINNTDQDPGILGEKAKYYAKKAVERRYALNPYLYTLFYNAHIYGGTVIKPMFHEFPTDKETWEMDEQFMWGSCFIVSPVLKEGETKVTSYIPKGEWWNFEFENSTQVPQSGERIEKDVGDYIPMYVKGGCIIPTEDVKLRTPSKSEPRNLTIYVYPLNKKAKGEFYIDDGLSKDAVEKRDFLLFEYILADCALQINTGMGTYYSGLEPRLKKVIVFDVGSADIVTVNSKPLTNYTLSQKILTVDIDDEMINVKAITWTNKDKECKM